MILLQSASWAIIDPTTQNSPLVRGCRTDVGPTTELQSLVLGQCQHANKDVLPTTSTITQHCLNDCLLSGLSHE